MRHPPRSIRDPDAYNPVLNTFNSGIDRAVVHVHILNMFKTTRFGRAIGRIVFGTVLIAGALVLVLRLAHARHPEAAEVLVTTWIVAILAWLVITPLVDIERPLGRLLKASFVLPTIGVALVLPLSLHMLVVLSGFGLEEFDGWAQWSLWIAGTSHIALAILAACRAAQLVDHEVALTPEKIFTSVIVVSCLPFALLFVIPPIIVGMTGLAFLPLLKHMEVWIAREQMPELPRAVAHFHLASSSSPASNGGL